jgi:hypothetical protein
MSGPDRSSMRATLAALLVPIVAHLALQTYFIWTYIHPLLVFMAMFTMSLNVLTFLVS